MNHFGPIGISPFVSWVGDSVQVIHIQNIIRILHIAKQEKKKIEVQYMLGVIFSFDT